MNGRITPTTNNSTKKRSKEIYFNIRATPILPDVRLVEPFTKSQREAKKSLKIARSQNGPNLCQMYIDLEKRNIIDINLAGLHQQRVRNKWDD